MTTPRHPNNTVIVSDGVVLEEEDVAAAPSSSGADLPQNAMMEMSTRNNPASSRSMTSPEHETMLDRQEPDDESIIQQSKLSTSGDVDEHNKTSQEEVMMAEMYKELANRTAEDATGGAVVSATRPCYDSCCIRCCGEGYEDCFGCCCCCCDWKEYVNQASSCPGACKNFLCFPCYCCAMVVCATIYGGLDDD